ncbi:hypothetical protein SDC9_196770 [bioreactor metagenome]|uniref:DUF4860 domain-containing protein n=1 Tax=bioreactor metagenome TaxID=1076179 RepID=A0A645IE08_9ZZZZ
MMLFLIIVMLSVMTIVMGKNIYSNINEDRKNNYELRVGLSYIANKIRQSDKNDAVVIKDINGTPAVVIKEIYDDLNYETWIYYYDNSIYELLTDEGSTFNLSDGMKIIEVHSFDIFKINDGLYKFSISNNVNTEELVLSLYSQAN